MKSKSKTDLELSIESERYAGIYSLKSANPNVRKRNFASIMLIYSLADFFRQQNLSVSNAKNLFKVPKIAEQFEITDLYVNNYRLDVRLAKQDYFYIPKIHYDFDILPDFYAVVSIDKHLKKPKFIGYIKPENIEKEEFNSKYYKVSVNALSNMSDFLTELKNEKKISVKSSDHRIFNNHILSYIDDEADNYTITKILQHVFACPDCRSELINFYGFEIIAKDTSKYSDIFNDNSLDIVGAIDPENSQYSEREEKIAIDLEDVREDDEIAEFDETFLGQSAITSPDAKDNNDLLLDGLFDNAPKVNRKTKNTSGETPINVPDPSKPKEISLENMEIINSNTSEIPSFSKHTSNDDILDGDIDILKETSEEQPKSGNGESLKDFLSKNSDNSSDNPPDDKKEDDNIKDLKSIPDEIFNDDYDSFEDNAVHHSNNKDNIKKMNKVVMDYDEYGQPIYSDSVSKNTEAKIQEDNVISLDDVINEKRDSDKSIESQDSIGEQYIEVDSENFENEYNNQQPEVKSRKHIYLLFIIFLIISVFYFVHMYVVSSNNSKTSEVVEKTNTTQNIDDMDINALEEVITQNVQNESKFVKLKTVNWICNTSLLSDSAYKTYLKTLDRRFKAKFKLNSISILQAPYNNNVSAEILVTADGVVKTYRISQSSGVKEIDDILLQSLKDAANNLKVPELSNPALSSDEYYLKVVLKL